MCLRPHISYDLIRERVADDAYLTLSEDNNLSPNEIELSDKELSESDTQVDNNRIKGNRYVSGGASGNRKVSEKDGRSKNIFLCAGSNYLSE